MVSSAHSNYGKKGGAFSLPFVQKQTFLKIDLKVIAHTLMRQ